MVFEKHLKASAYIIADGSVNSVPVEHSSNTTRWSKMFLCRLLQIFGIKRERENSGYSLVFQLPAPQVLVALPAAIGNTDTSDVLAAHS